MRITRFGIILASVVAAASSWAAPPDSLIHDEAMETYRSALQESGRNKAKSSAMLKGLLLETLTVGIESSSVPFDSPQFESGVRDAVNVWNEALGERVFAFAAQQTTPDITIRFVPKVKNADSAQGYVQAQRRFFWKGLESSATISGNMQIRDNIGRRYMNGQEVMRVAAHELGHLLGLADQPSADGLMSDFVAGRGPAGPSRNEIQAVLDFRRQLRRALDAN